MPNPGGGNQFGNFTLQPQYGDVKKQTQLTREAPISGSPLAAQALNTPRRNQKQAQRPQKPPVAPGGEPMLPPAQPQPAPAAVASQVWQQIAQQPWAQNEPVIQQLAAQAQNGG